MEQSNNVRLKFTDIFIVDSLFSLQEVDSLIKDIDISGIENSKLVKKAMDEIIGSVNGKYANKNGYIFTMYQEGMILPKISFVLNLKGTVNIKLGVNDKTYSLKQGTFLMFPTHFRFELDKNDSSDYLIIGHTTYSDDILNIKNGTNSYTIISSILDEYKLIVKADTEEEAIEKASKINVSAWEHLDLHPNLEDQVITKFSKWGNFRIEK